MLPTTSGADLELPAFITQVFECLRQMDCEANVPREDHPTGLAWYGGHYQPHLPRPKTEPSWSRRLAELLPSHGYPSEAEVCYPDRRRCKCDVVSILPSKKSVWIEIKGAWKEYWAQKGGQWIYRSYLLHPLAPNLDPKPHTVPLDLQRLSGLSKSDADFVVCLLVGFDAALRPMDNDIDELRTLAKLTPPKWSESESRWPDVYRPGCRVSCWAWHRET